MPADGLGLEPKTGSLWWTITCAQECKTDILLVLVDKIRQKRKVPPGLACHWAKGKEGPFTIFNTNNVRCSVGGGASDMGSHAAPEIDMLTLFENVFAVLEYRRAQPKRQQLQGTHFACSDIYIYVYTSPCIESLEILGHPFERSREYIFGMEF